MFEVELKFRIDDRDGFRRRLDAEGAVVVSKCKNADTYYNHPCRDFAQTGEALRIRREDDVPMVTYKAPKLPGIVKAREELEWRLDPGDVDGSSMQRLLERLGFRKVATVVKHRTTFRLGTTEAAMTITMDAVEGIGGNRRVLNGEGRMDDSIDDGVDNIDDPSDNVGHYAEIECVLPGDPPLEEELQAARDRVLTLANRLGLSSPESRSYLRLMLGQ